MYWHLKPLFLVSALLINNVLSYFHKLANIINSMNCCFYASLFINHEPLCVILPWNDPKNMRCWHALWGDVLVEHCAYTPWDRFKLWHSCAEQQSCTGTFHLKKKKKRGAATPRWSTRQLSTVELSSSLLFNFISLPHFLFPKQMAPPSTLD